MEGKQFIEKTPPQPRSTERVVRLTEAGRLEALGGRDPLGHWSRTWDGVWRIILYDVPIKLNSLRQQFARHLRSRRFGRLQNSVWITPDPLEDEQELLDRIEAAPQALICLAASPCAGERNEEIVAAAWDFDRINLAYQAHLKILAARPTQPLIHKELAQSLRKWAAQEASAWQDAAALDPFLPECLLPGSYLGQKAWRERIKTLADAAQQIRTFRL